MNLLKLTLMVSLSSALLIASPSKKEIAKYNKVLKIGDRSSKMLLKTLGKNMKKNMKKGGVFKALDFCSMQAYNLTETVNKRLPNGVRVKRISTQFRSPANKPSAEEEAILKSFESLKNLNVVLPKYLVEKVNSHTFKYYKPLVINKKVCLKCHGDVKDIELKRAIASKYPIDNAMGYKMGDLRGAIVTTIDTSIK